jgi:GNAT superfamily N-acetyltransferase
MNFAIKTGYDRPEEVKELFIEYTDMLVKGEPAFVEYLGIQNFDEELKHLEKKYGMPGGRLYLLYVNDALAGCVALRKMDKEKCELKRLYVKPKFRGEGYGDLLLERIMGDARRIGYKYMYLDTLPFLKTALRMYKRFGFEEIERYNDSPLDSTIFMRCKL